MARISFIAHPTRRLPATASALPLALLLCTLGASPALAGEIGEPASRYRIEVVDLADSHPATSSCGRYAIQAQARYAPEARSPDGRYALKAVHLPAAGCDPFPDPLFANGFETPMP